MGEEDEDNPHKTSSKGSIPRARPPRTPKPQTSEPNLRRPRPGRAQRQQRRDAAESSAPTAGPSSTTSTTPSNLNPAAADFVPGQVFVTPTVVVAEQTPSSVRGRPRGGRRGKQPERKNGNENKNENENVGTSSSSSRPAGQRPRKNDNAKLRVQPKIIKESEDLMLRMTEALTKAEYDCSICTDSVL